MRSRHVDKKQSSLAIKTPSACFDAESGADSSKQLMERLLQYCRDPTIKAIRCQVTKGQRGAQTASHSLLHAHHCSDVALEPHTVFDEL